MKPQRCKGMKDLIPAEMAIFRQIENIYCSCCLRWGYKEVRTPTIEYMHLFTSAGTLTPGMLGRVYSFLDWDGWSGERVVLRPDGTIPVARLYTEHYQGKELARLFYSTDIFRFEETGEKPRERWQCGAELIGTGSTAADTELILLSLEVMEKLGLKDIELRLSHAGLIKSLLDKVGINPEVRNRLFDRILDGEIEVLTQIKREFPGVEDALIPFLKMKGRSLDFIRNQRAVLIKDMPEIGPHLDDFLQIVSILDSLGYSYTIDIASGAGFEYYTGVVFQLYVNDEKVGGGGRYDALIPAMGGGNVPASGLALYLERLVKLVNSENLAAPAPAVITLRALTANVKSNVKKIFILAKRLRDSGYIAELSLDGIIPGEASWVVDMAEKSGQLTLTDLADNSKYEMSGIDETVKFLEGQIGRETGPA